MPDDLAVALAEIQERSEVASKITVSWKAQIQQARASADDVPRLLTALDEVLKLANEARVTLSFPPADCTNACGDGPCNCSGKFRAAGWELDPDTIREAISRALLRAGAGDE